METVNVTLLSQTVLHLLPNLIQMHWLVAR